MIWAAMCWRGQARLLRGMAFVMAARGIGMRETASVLRCILPNAAPPLLAQASVAMAQAMMMEASLSFLGLGVQPPQPSWGGMLRDALGFADRAVWLAWSPAAALFLTVAGLTVASDGLRDLLYPRSSLQ